MLTLADLKNQAKTLGLRGYSTMKRDDLEALLRGEKVARYGGKQRHTTTQTDFDCCEKCMEKTYLRRLQKEYLISIRKRGALYCDACNTLMSFPGSRRQHDM